MIPNFTSVSCDGVKRKRFLQPRRLSAAARLSESSAVVVDLSAGEPAEDDAASPVRDVLKSQPAHLLRLTELLQAGKPLPRDPRFLLAEESVKVELVAANEQCYKSWEKWHLR